MPTDTLVHIGGCGGSFAAPSENRPVFDPEAPWKLRREPFRRDIYGGRTTCYFLRHRDTFVVIDHGLGIDPVSEFILDILEAEQKKVHLIHCLQTHFHDDHWSGMQSNLLLFQKGLTLRYYSPELSPYRAEKEDLPPGKTMMQQVLEDCFPLLKKYWPVTLETLDQIGARREHVSFRPGETLSLDGLPVATIPLIHPDGCSGFRFEIPGAGPVVVATDYEPPEQSDPAVVQFFDGARLLLADMQYRDSEYEGKQPIGRLTLSRRGWGHGTPGRLFPILKRCRHAPGMVRIVHHDPKRSDMQLRLFFEETVNLLGEKYHLADQLDYEFAHDGDVFWL
jgi:glyoxylase-like metal-dependent hydrolase (beta-lactamase superfamily II)